MASRHPFLFSSDNAIPFSRVYICEHYQTYQTVVLTMNYSRGYVIN